MACALCSGGVDGVHKGVGKGRGMNFPAAMDSAVARQPSLRESRFALILFAACLCFHFWGITVGWTSRALPGVEFRQAQTALGFLDQGGAQFLPGLPDAVARETVVDPDGVSAVPVDGGRGE